MTAAKTHTKEIVIPLSLIVVGSLLQAVLPSSETLEKLLLSYLKNKWLLWELRVSIVSLLVLLTYRAYLQHTVKKSSTEIIKSYMETAHKIETENYEKGVVAVNNNMAARGIYSSGIAVMNIKDLKLSHIKSFVENCLEYVESTINNYLLDKPSVKLLFENYQTNDITEFTEIINSQYTARGLNIRQDIMPSITSEINNAYSIALLRIDAM